MSSSDGAAPDDDGFADFFAMSLDCLCVAGVDGYFKRVNASWTRTLGWTAEELLAIPSIDLLHPDDRALTLAARARLLARESMGSLRNRYRCKDGSYRWFEWRSIAHLERGFVYAAARDITEQIVAEERLREATAREAELSHQLVFAHRLASVGILASGVAHEINNPLAAVTANIEMLLDRLTVMGADASAPTSTTASLAESRGMALDVQAGAERIQHIVRELATYSRGEGERRIALEVAAVVELAARLATGELRQRAGLVKELGPTPLVLADEASLAQVLVNLIVNAIQALPVAVEGAMSRHEIRIVTSTDASGRAVIEVCDSGPGISAAIIDRIFDPFFTTKPVGAGAGLGLYVCHNLVSAMGGDITASNGPGGGAIFRVTLPAAVPPVAATPPRPSSSPPSSGGASEPTTARATILVVDDDRAVGVALCRVLRGHDVCAVTEAKRGLEMLAAGQEFDVIISDLMMPGMSGMEFYDELTRRFPAAAERVVFISGGTFTPSAQAFLGRVPNARLAKPFDARKLRELVELAVAR